MTESQQLFASFTEPGRLFSVLVGDDAPPPPPPVSPEAQAMLDNYTNEGVSLVDAERSFMVEYVDNLLNSGNYSKIDYETMFPLGATNPVNALVDWKGGKLATNNGATFDVFGANYAGAQHINHNFNPTNDAINYSLNDAIMGAFVQNNANPTKSNATIFSASNLAETRQQSDRVRFGLNDGEGGNQRQNTFFPSDTLFMNNRFGPAGNQINQYANGVIVTGIFQTIAATAIPNLNVYSGARNGNTAATLFFEGTLANLIIGASIGFDQVAYNFNLRTLLSGLGTI